MFTQTVMRHEKAEKRKSPNDTNKLFVYLQLFERGKHTFAHYKIFQRRLFTIVFLASSYPQDLFQTWLFIQSWFDLIKRNQQKQFKRMCSKIGLQLNCFDESDVYCLRELWHHRHNHLNTSNRVHFKILYKSWDLPELWIENIHTDSALLWLLYFAHSKVVFLKYPVLWFRRRKTLY